MRPFTEHLHVVVDGTVPMPSAPIAICSVKDSAVPLEKQGGVYYGPQ
jgi:hypothetical protein